MRQLLLRHRLQDRSLDRFDMTACNRCAEMRRLLLKAVERGALLQASKIAAQGLKEMASGKRGDADGTVRSSNDGVGKED